MSGIPGAVTTSGVIGGELVTSGTGAVAAGPATTVMQQEQNKDRHPGISLSLIEDIHTNPYQPRRDFEPEALEELAQSIRANGIIQPLVVRKRAQGGGWELIAGERRLRAAKMAGLRQVPIVIRRSTDRESLELALVENIQRQNLNCVDEALAYTQLAEDFSLTQEEIAVRVGKDRATVANYLRLLRLPEAVIDDLKKQVLSFGHGKALLSIDDNEARLQIRAQVVEKRLSVRDTEALVDQFKHKAEPGDASGATQAAKPLSALAARMAALGQELTRHWSAKVDVKGSERRGKIIIHYASRQELERILEAMKN
ncbi:MAG: ParB/RepB/Spo0J family partition protein [Oligoflexia bacterium]|nr:ParB/RepB/Spo0J family partition protein [Oligoflexia bacterium]